MRRVATVSEKSVILRQFLYYTVKTMAFVITGFMCRILLSITLFITVVSESILG